MNYIQTYLEDISDERHLLYNAMRRIAKEQTNAPFIKKCENLLDYDDEQLGSLKEAYRKFAEEVKNACDQLINKVDSLERKDDQRYKDWLKSINNLKDDIDSDVETLEEQFIYKDKEPIFYYRGNVASEGLNRELVMKYPDCTISQQLRKNILTADGDFYIDLPADNADLIVKYMKGDDSIVEDIKKLTFKQKQAFLKDLAWHRLPLNPLYIEALGCNEENELMEAWRGKTVLVNGQQDPEFNTLLKLNGALEQVFNNKSLNEIHVNEDKSVTVDLQLNHPEIMKNFLRNHMNNIDIRLLRNNYGKHIDSFEHDFQVCNIHLDKLIHNQMKAFFIRPSEVLIGSKLMDQQFDSYLREWAGDHQWELIYRASEHKFSPRSFHESCDDKGPTIVIAKSIGGSLMGGYTTKSWKYGEGIYYTIHSSFLDHYKKDPQAFIFTLKNPHGTTPICYHPKRQDRLAIDCLNYCGPKFGVCDMIIGQQGNRCSVYNEEKGEYQFHPQYKAALYVCTNHPNNDNKFFALDYEVFAYKK